MEQFISNQLATAPGFVLALVMVFSIITLGKGADWLVDEAVSISIRLGLPRVIVGATLVSLGTTAPEAVVSVLAAVQGNPGLALGNSVGSIICDTGLILGLACLIDPLPIDRRLVNRQGWVQFSAGVLLVASCFPWHDPAAAFTGGHYLPQYMGFVFCALLAIYLWWSIRETSSSTNDDQPEEAPTSHVVEEKISVLATVAKLVAAIVMVVIASAFLVGTAETVAIRLKIPQGIISATIVAFGTSLPELVTAMAAVRKKQGELAVGNVIGADILNVLFVAGAAASVTDGGLQADAHFFKIQFPAMLILLVLFRFGIWQSKKHGKLSRGFGVALLVTYVVYTIISWTLGGPGSSAAHG